MPEDRYLGTIDFATSNYAKIRPKLRLDQNGWTEIDRPEAEYPPDGKVFYPGTETMNAVSGDIWEFSVKENETQGAHNRAGGQNGPGVNRIAYGLARPKAAIDLSSLSLDEAREWIVEIGLDTRPFDPSSVYVKLSEALWVNFEMEEVDGRWRPALRTDLEHTVLWQAERTYPILDFQGAQLLQSSFALSKRSRTVDWTTDEMFIRSVPDRLKKLFGTADQNLPTIIGPDSLAPFAAIERILPATTEHLSIFRDRFSVFLSRIEKNYETVKDIFAAIRQQPAILVMISDEATEIADRSRDEIRNEISSNLLATWNRDHADLVGQKEKLSSELTALEDRNRSSIARLAETKKKAETVERGIAEVVDGLRTALERTPKKSADRAKAIGTHVEKLLGGQENVLVPCDIAPWSTGSAAGQPIEMEALRSALEAISKMENIVPGDLLFFDSAVRSGEIVMVAGDDRAAFLGAYAAVVTGGEMRRMPLDIGVIGTDDLWRQPGTGQPTAFAHAWVAARSRPDRPVLLILDNANATTGWNWLPPFSEYMTSDSRPKNLLICATIPEIETSHSDGFRSAVKDLVRMKPSSTMASGISTASRLLDRKSDDMPLTYLTGMDRTTEIEPDESDGVLKAILGTGIGSGNAARIVRLFVAAKITHDDVTAVGLSGAFAKWFDRSADINNAFGRHSSGFDEFCSMGRATK